MRKDIVINLDNYGNAANYKQAIGISGENLQGRLLFQLESPIDGEGYVELLHDDITELVPAEKEDNKTYYIPIKNTLLDYSIVYFQLRINERSEKGLPIFKSVKLTGYVGDAINASTSVYDPYPDWVSKADAQLEEYKRQEEERKTNENQRIENEDTRNENEKVREQNENTRIANENTRISNEKARETYINDLKQSVDNGAFNGADFNYNWDGTKLGVKNSKETEYEYVDLKGDKGDKGDVGDFNFATFDVDLATGYLIANKTENLQLIDFVIRNGNLEVIING